MVLQSLIELSRFEQLAKTKRLFLFTLLRLNQPQINLDCNLGSGLEFAAKSSEKGKTEISQQFILSRKENKRETPAKSELFWVYR